jgi:hypothetical protein
MSPMQAITALTLSNVHQNVHPDLFGYAPVL